MRQLVLDIRFICVAWVFEKVEYVHDALERVLDRWVDEL